MMPGEERGTGRTTRALLAISRVPAVYVVHNTHMAEHVRHTLLPKHRKDLRRHDICIRVITHERDIDNLRGVTVPVHVDHAWWDRAGEVMRWRMEHILLAQAGKKIAQEERTDARLA